MPNFGKSCEYAAKIVKDYCLSREELWFQLELANFLKNQGIITDDVILGAVVLSRFAAALSFNELTYDFEPEFSDIIRVFKHLYRGYRPFFQPRFEEARQLMSFAEQIACRVTDGWEPSVKTDSPWFFAAQIIIAGEYLRLKHAFSPPFPNRKNCATKWQFQRFCLVSRFIVRPIEHLNESLCKLIVELLDRGVVIGNQTFSCLSKLDAETQKKDVDDYLAFLSASHAEEHDQH